MMNMINIITLYNTNPGQLSHSTHQNQQLQESLLVGC